MLKKALCIAFTIVALPVSLTLAHVGSPGVVFEGKAGSYDLLVSVTPPDVIPGVAEVSIYTLSPSVEAISAKPIYWGVGDEGSPKSDPMFPVEGQPGQYEGIVWFMSSGTASIEVEVQGANGEGKCVVPIMATATAQNEMEPGLGYLLAGLGLLLVILMVTIISAATSDSLIAPGEKHSNLKGRRFRGAVAAAVILGLVLYGGKTWWDAEAGDYQRYMYKPPQAISTVDFVNGQRVMTFQVDSNSLASNRLPMEYMIPDHGKLMHMFMIREGALDVFAHLHPRRVDPLTFEVSLPEVPEGRYYVFGDIVRLNGFTETIADTLDIPAMPTPMIASDVLADPDDTFIFSTAANEERQSQLPGDILICGKPGIETPLLDGSTAVFEYQPNQSFQVGKVYPLTFAINAPDGSPAELQPYMGMMGHAVVFRKEGGVYVHLHPVGNYSMASQEIIETRIDEDTPRPTIPEMTTFYDSVDQVVDYIAELSEDDRNVLLTAGMEHTGLGLHEEHGSTVTFPYAFPQAGEYRIWIQMKRDGEVLNSSFDATVL
ncbi:MAG: hypothetical protein AAGA85_07435 [Bacteroidota bacterium]